MTHIQHPSSISYLQKSSSSCIPFSSGLPGVQRSRSLSLQTFKVIRRKVTMKTRRSYGPWINIYESYILGHRNVSPGFSKSESKALLIRDMNHMRSSHVTSDCVTPCSSRGAFIHNSFLKILFSQEKNTIKIKWKANSKVQKVLKKEQKMQHK